MLNYAGFTSEQPLDQLPRALDELRRIGFDLFRIEVTPEETSVQPAPSRIRILYRGSGAVSSDTYLARIARLPGVSAIEGGACAP